MGKPLVVFLHSHRLDRVYQAANLVLTAASMGRRCHLFLFYGALATFLDGSWEDMDRLGLEGNDADWAQSLASGFELADGPSPYAILEMARREPGGLTVCACSTSVKRLALEPAAVSCKVDQIVGLAAMLEIAAEGQALYI